MAILSYPILFYRSKIDMEMNFNVDLQKLGISCYDTIEKSIQEKCSYPDIHITVLITKVVRNSLKTGNPDNFS